MGLPTESTETDFSGEDKDLLEALANVYKAVDVASASKACETLRETALRQRDRLAIGADALRLFIRARGEGINFDTKEWREYFGLANDIEERGKSQRRGDNVRKKRFRQLRIVARLTVVWGPEVLKHYRFTDWNFEKLDCLAKCAEKLHDFAQFSKLANPVMLERHEKSLTSNTHDRIGQHSSRNQHNKVASPEPHQPLQKKDVDRIVKFLQSKATLILNGHTCDTLDQLRDLSNRTEEWVQDDIENVNVSGMALKKYPSYRAGNYQLGYDRYGLLVPRDYEDEASCQTRRRKRQREEHTEALDEEIAKGQMGRKRTRISSALIYPSPPPSSPKSSVLSSPPSSTDSDGDSELDDGTDEEPRSSRSPRASSKATETSGPSGEDPTNKEEERLPISPRREPCSPDQRGTEWPAHPYALSVEQESPTQPSLLDLSNKGTIVTYEAESTVLSQSEQISPPQTIPETSSQHGTETSCPREDGSPSQRNPDPSQPVIVTSLPSEHGSLLQPQLSASVQQGPGSDSAPLLEQETSVQVELASKQQRHHPQLSELEQSQPALSSSAQFEALLQFATYNHDALETSHFDAHYFSPSKDSSSNDVDRLARYTAPFMYDKAFSDHGYVLRPPDTAASARSFNSLVNFSPDTPNAPESSPARPYVPRTQKQDTGANQPLNIVAERTQDSNESHDQAQRGLQVVPFNLATPNSPSFPNFRAIASSTDTTLETVFSPQGSPSSIGELVDSLNQENETSTVKGPEKESDGDLITVRQGDKATSPTPQIEERETPRSCPSSEGCPVCNGVCTVCQVPTDFDKLMRNKLFNCAHRAHELEKMAPNATLREWIGPLIFASYIPDNAEGEGDVCLLSCESFKRLAETGQVFKKPIVIRESFADSKGWSPSRYANRLERAFEGTEVDVRWHQDSEAERVAVSRLVELLRTEPSDALLENPPNVLNLPDITSAILPNFLSLDRFCLLDLLIERCKADSQKHIGKQTHLTPFDVGSCRRFNILGWPGAFSGPHVDSNGATWVRNLFGHKLWMFVPKSEMTPNDWKQFAEDGHRWNPQKKCRGVILEPGDVFIMQPGLVHAVQTLGNTEPCLITGGMFLDESDLLRSLETLLWIGKNQNATNEPIAYQFAQIISTLDGMVERNPMRWFSSHELLSEFGERMRSLRSLGCNCDDCADECQCSEEGRRCTPLCTAHLIQGGTVLPCMLESRNTRDEDSENSDGEYVD